MHLMEEIRKRENTDEEKTHDFLYTSFAEQKTEYNII